MIPDIVACPSCGCLNNLEIAGPACWKCARAFTEQDFFDFEAHAASQIPAIEPEVKPTKVSNNADMIDFVGKLIGVGLVLGPLIFLLSWCTSGPSPPTEAEIQEQAAAAQEARLYGVQCLSGWDGSNSDVVDAVKASLRDPSSFKHVETRTTPIDANGKHVLMMKFRATNGFGGPTIGMARAILDGNSCRVKIDQIEG